MAPPGLEELESLRETIRAACVEWGISVDLDWVPVEPLRMFERTRYGRKIRLTTTNGVSITFGELDQLADEIAQLPESPDPGIVPLMGGRLEAWYTPPGASAPVYDDSWMIMPPRPPKRGGRRSRSQKRG